MQTLIRFEVFFPGFSQFTLSMNKPGVVYIDSILPRKSYQAHDGEGQEESGFKTSKRGIQRRGFRMRVEQDESYTREKEKRPENALFSAQAEKGHDWENIGPLNSVQSALPSRYINNVCKKDQEKTPDGVLIDSV
jgi:hypothetical protein